MYNITIWKKIKEIFLFFLNKPECADFSHPVDWVTNTLLYYSYNLIAKLDLLLY